MNTDLGKRRWCRKCGETRFCVLVESGWYCRKHIPQDELARLLEHLHHPD